MKAIVYEKYGTPSVLQLKDVTKPTPRPNEVLIKIHATTVTAGDARMRGFNVPLSFWLPARILLGITKPKRPILGMEMSGEIEAVGSDVTKFKPGDHVFASTFEKGFGGYAEYLCFPENGLLVKKSSDLSSEEAVTIPVGGRTALYFLRAANVQAGQKVLIYGASGSVGTFAVQLAKYFGANVTGLCSTSNVEMVRSLGADHVIDYTQENFAQTGESYDVIFDTVGKSSVSDCLRVLMPGGAYLHAVSNPAVNLRMLLPSLTSGKRFVGGSPPRKKEDLIFLQNLMEDGTIKPIIDKRYSLEEIPEAHRYVDTGRKKGNVIITVAN